MGSIKSRSFGQIITFYSYKGGTGRSMSLANVAHLMASNRYDDQRRRDTRVLAIDWDLEAPGLHLFFATRFQRRFGRAGTEQYADALNGAKGLLDFLTDVAAFYRKAKPNGRLPESMANESEARVIFREAMAQFPIKDYLLAVDDLPSLSLLKAGSQRNDVEMDESYSAKARRFDWPFFYREYGSFFALLREHLAERFDVVLIDSRTGLTDIGGICTRVMPEKLVTVFAPNKQNIDGVTHVAETSVKYRMRSRDPRSLTIFPLASRIDASASKLRRTWWRGGKIREERIEGYQKRFETLLREIYQIEQCDLSEYFEETQIPHDSDYAYGEDLAAWRDGTDDRFTIGYACDQLAQRLARLTAPWENLSSNELTKKPGNITRGSLGVEILKVDLSEAVDVRREQEVQAVAPSMPCRAIAPRPMGDESSVVDEAIPWGVRAVGAAETRYTGQGITVAILDSGIDPIHSAFSHIELIERNFTDEGKEDELGSGTNYAGIVFGRLAGRERIGVATGVERALIGKIIDRQGNSSTDKVFEAIQWAADLGAHVILFSIHVDLLGYSTQLQEYQDLPVEVAMAKAQHAYTENALFFEQLSALLSTGPRTSPLMVGAGGDQGQSAPVGLPASTEDCLAVGALGTEGLTTLRVADFSNHGVDVSGPGVGVLSARTGGGLIRRSGTGIAAAHVAGVAALWAEKLHSDPRWSLEAKMLKARLLGRATEASLAKPFEPQAVGSGMVQAPKE